ncbi:hypothetical protein ACFXNY_27380, partial [Streptomyces sindenensis]
MAAEQMADRGEEQDRTPPAATPSAAAPAGPEPGPGPGPGTPPPPRGPHHPAKQADNQTAGP